MTKFLNISVDNTLGGVSPSDEVVSSQKALKTYIDNHSGGGGLPSQTGNAGKFLTTDGTDASWGRVKTNNLFDNKWCDYELNDQNWLRADTFSWQDGTVYTQAYNHLVNDIQGKSASTETVNGTTVTYYLADDGHKIVLAANVSAIETVYSSTGVAWYYVLDTTNQRFKLPRINPAKEVLGVKAPVSVYGNGKALGLTNGTTNYGLEGVYGASYLSMATGAYDKVVSTGASQQGLNGAGKFGVTTDASKSGIVGQADLSNTSGVYKGNQYLYFYVGQFSQSATEQTAGLNSELFNGKADLDLTNASANASSVAKKTIIGWFMPDYTTGVSISLTNGTTLEWTAPYNCLLSVTGSGSSSSNVGMARIQTMDNQDIARTDIATGSVSRVWTFVNEGDKVKITAKTTNVSGIYFALKGNAV